MTAPKRVYQAKDDTHLVCVHIPAWLYAQMKRRMGERIEEGKPITEEKYIYRGVRLLIKHLFRAVNSATGSNTGEKNSYPLLLVFLGEIGQARCSLEPIYHQAGHRGSGGQSRRSREPEPRAGAAEHGEDPTL